MVAHTLLSVPHRFPPFAYVSPRASASLLESERSQAFLAKFGQQLQMAVGRLKPKPALKATHERVLHELDAAVRSCAPPDFPDAGRRRPFVSAVGSMVTGVARHGSDADVSVSAPWLRGSEGLRQLAAVLREAGHFGQ